MNTIGQLVISGLLIGSVYALMSIGLTLIFGVLRVVNFAHGEFLMIAMYGAWAFSRLLGLNPYFAAIAVVPAMFLFGALVYRLVIGSALAKPHLVVVFATMGLSIFLQNIALMAMTADLRDVPPIFARSISIGGIYIKGELLLGFIVTLLCTVILQWVIKRTFLGKAIRATVQDGEAAKLMGIAVPKIFLITFAAGSALVGLAACVMLPLFSVFPTVGLNFVLIAFVIVVLGGMGSIEGALLGGFCVGVVQSVSSYYVAPAFGQLFFFLLFLLVMIFRPNGLFGQKGAATLGMNE
ncbi:branched-chain amino acid ABC transporter permease [Bradyrhizobium erythrophlei]|uniref:Amino acid/amide ABC transporter membrane protein 1, HAAT family n=1 Tax=Bradyrhizobium erythrophlei TaxID=1437360 RepID=A0A1M7UVX0_9BRAD|nr:branched-chain amino acid ABC transporter permease [Bradyrhizobium erythrophlei]SHN87088.1 amino acid/amide ABC transporter membrane protein 1, HAAT family [Bradyrhizobium erythrophlei]